MQAVHVAGVSGVEFGAALFGGVEGAHIEDGFVVVVVVMEAGVEVAAPERAVVGVERAGLEGWAHLVGPRTGGGQRTGQTGDGRVG